MARWKQITVGIKDTLAWIILYLAYLLDRTKHKGE